MAAMNAATTAAAANALSAGDAHLPDLKRPSQEIFDVWFFS
jgi:hypothetical protein